MDKRDRLERTLAGESCDRAPVALWRPFPGDDQRAADYAQAVVDFQLRFDWDLCVIVPPYGFAGADYGLQDTWNGDPTGIRMPIRYPVRRSLDWTDLRSADPNRGDFGRIGTTVRTVCEGLAQTGVPVVLGVLSPLAQASRLAGPDIVRKHLRTRPDRLKSGLATLTEATLRFLDSLRNCGLSGVALFTEHADCDVLSEEEYETFGLSGDSNVLSSVPKGAWLKIAYVSGLIPMGRLFARLGANVIAWDDRSAELDLQTGRSAWSGAICGGLDADKHLRAGTPTSIRDAARDALHIMGNRRLIVGCGRPLPLTVPQSNLRAARTAVERTSVA